MCGCGNGRPGLPAQTYFGKPNPCCPCPTRRRKLCCPDPQRPCPSDCWPPKQCPPPIPMSLFFPNVFKPCEDPLVARMQCPFPMPPCPSAPCCGPCDRRKPYYEKFIIPESWCPNPPGITELHCCSCRNPYRRQQ